MMSCSACAKTTEGFHSDRRIVTVLFADLSGFTALCEQLDPEQVTEMLNQCFALLSQPVYAYGGMVDKYIGDALMAVFGAPTTHEDDPERALAAALEMQRAAETFAAEIARRHGYHLQLRIGLNTGLVVAGAVGDELRRSYTVIGDTVNLAQRMEAAAEPGHIMVAPQTYRQAHHRFAFKALPPVAVKGKREPIAAFELLGRKGSAPVPLPRVSLIGRDHELELLLTHWAKALEDTPQWVTLQGEAGIGKTELAHAFLQRAMPVCLLRVRGVSYQQDRAHGLVRDCLRACLGLEQDASPAAVREVLLALPRLRPPEMRLLGMLLGAPKGWSEDSSPLAAVDLQRALALALEVLLLQLRQQRTVLVVEDLQWVDAPSLAWLEEVARVLLASRAQVLVLALSRHALPFDSGSPQQRTLRLKPLCRAMARQLIEGFGQHQPLTPRERKLLLERADGNPMVLRELVRQHQEGVSSDGALALTVNSLVASRLDRLEPSQRQLLEAAAVIGRRFTLPQLRDLSELPDPAPLLQALCEQEFIRPLDPEGFCFLQGIVHEVTYQSCLHRRRQKLHLRLAEMLVASHGPDPKFAAVIASHFLSGAMPKRALSFLLRASAYAAETLAFLEAKQHMQRALQLAAEHGESVSLAELWHSLADIEKGLGDYPAAQRSLAAALAQESDGARRFALLRDRAQLLEHQGCYQEALATLLEAESEVGASSPSRLGLLLVDRGWILLRLGDAIGAEAACRKALERLGDHGEAAERAKAWSILGILAYRQNRWEEASELHLQALALREKAHDRLGVAASLNNLGMVAAEAGLWQAALQWYRLSLARYRQQGARTHVATLYNNLGDLYVRCGELAKAERRHRAALAIRERLGDRFGVAASNCALGETLRQAGNTLLARRHLQGGVRGLEAIGETELLAEACHALGQVELQAGSYAAASRWLRRALKEALRNKDFLRVGAVYRAEAQVALAQGRLGPARAKLEAAKGQLSQRELHVELARTLEVEAELLLAEGHGALALQCAERARNLLAELGAKQAVLSLEPFPLSARTG